MQSEPEKDHGPYTFLNLAPICAVKILRVPSTLFHITLSRCW